MIIYSYKKKTSETKQITSRERINRQKMKEGG
jgi:hypothetical protein